MKTTLKFLAIILLIDTINCEETKTCDKDALDNLLTTKYNVSENCWFLQIYSVQVNDLCEGSIRNKSELMELTFLNNSLKDIPPGVFQNLPSLSIVRFYYNDIRRIRKGVFTIGTLRSIDLSSNGIEIIENGAFNDLPELWYLTIQNNRLKEFSADWFGGKAGMYHLNLNRNYLSELPERVFSDVMAGVNFCNLHLSSNNISKIHPKAFAGLSKEALVQIEMHFENNQLVELDDDLFAGMRLSELYLYGNSLTCLSDRFLDNLNQTRTLDVSKNPLKSDCVVKVKKWMETSGATVYFDKNREEEDYGLPSDEYEGKEKGWVYFETRD